jgi:hypothetical protein
MPSSDEAETQQLNIYFDEAVRFFKSQSSPGECPMCKSVSWALPSEIEGSPLSLSDSGMRTLDDSPVLELKIICNVCGFLRAHRASFIREWLDKNPAGDEVTENV